MPQESVRQIQLKERVFLFVSLSWVSSTMWFLFCVILELLREHSLNFDVGK